MKHTYRLFLFSLTILFSLTHCKLFKKPLSELELDELSTNTHETYLYLGKDASSIEKTITHICKLDTALDSPVAALKKHLDDGFTIGLQSEVIETLEYAQLFLKEHKHARSKKIKELTKQVIVILQQIDNDELSVTPTKRKKNDSDTKERSVLESYNKSCSGSKKHKKCSDTCVIKNNLRVKCDAKIKGELQVKDDAYFNDDVHCDDDIILKDSLYMRNSENKKIGNVFKDKKRFIHNFGCNNTFVGVEAGNFEMQGNDNSGFGAQTLTVNKWGMDNTAVGSQALTFNTDGNNNVAVGTRALRANTTGINNVAIGTDTLRSNVTGHANTGVGYRALELNNGMNNCAFGRETLAVNTTGEANIAVGAFALNANTTGEFNIAVGSQAMESNTYGEHNIAIGAQALRMNTTGIDNIAVGGHTLQLNRVNGNVAVGNRALSANTIGNNNVAVGRNALTANTTGDDNTVIGNFAMENNTIGRLNVAVGKSALRNCTTGNTNIAVGLQAGINLTTGNNNIYIDNAGIADEHNAIRIGTDGKQNKCFLQGVFQNQFGSAQTDVQVEVGTGKLGIQTSSAQFKENIKRISPEYSHKLYELHPVIFNYKHDPLQKKNIGLLAEDVAEVFPELVIYDENGNPFTICYKLLSVLLLSEMQHMNETIEMLKEIIKTLKQEQL